MKKRAVTSSGLLNSWRRFKLGLGLFVAGAFSLLLLSHIHRFLYYFSLGVLLIGFVIAISGYLMLLWHRLKVINPRARPPSADE